MQTKVLRYSQTLIFNYFNELKSVRLWVENPTAIKNQNKFEKFNIQVRLC